MALSDEIFKLPRDIGLKGVDALLSFGNQKAIENAAARAQDPLRLQQFEADLVGRMQRLEATRATDTTGLEQHAAERSPELPAGVLPEIDNVIVFRDSTAETQRLAEEASKLSHPASHLLRQIQ